MQLISRAITSILTEVENFKAAAFHHWNNIILLNPFFISMGILIFYNLPNDPSFEEIFISFTFILSAILINNNQMLFVHKRESFVQ